MVPYYREIFMFRIIPQNLFLVLLSIRFFCNRDTVNARLKNDIIVCCLTSVILFLLHQSDVFAKTFPQLGKLQCGSGGGGAVLGVIRFSCAIHLLR